MPSHLTNSDLLLEGSGDSSLLSPHLPSPSLQETTSPIFSSLTSLSPVPAYRSPSIDLHRRSSLHTVEPSRMSEPNIFRRSSLDPLSSQKLGGQFNFHQEGAPYASPLVHSPTPLIPGGPPRPSQRGANIGRMPPSTRDLCSSPQSLLQAEERSKSLENISHTVQPAPSHLMKRRMSAQVPLVGAMPSKKAR